jgi:hypothetical protein
MVSYSLNYNKIEMYRKRELPLLMALPAAVLSYGISQEPMRYAQLCFFGFIQLDKRE